MKSNPAGTFAIDRALALFEALVRDAAARPLSAIAAELGLPPSTAHRMAGLLVRRGLIAPAQRGYYAAGLKLAELGAHSDHNCILAKTARPLLRRLARDTGATAHLGVWDGDMVTYLVKENSRNSVLFTQEGGQLEAYCSAIGKVLLANLEPAKQAAYLAASPFIAITEHTVTEPEDLKAMLQRVEDNGYGVDEQEIAEGLFCIALPIWRAGQVVAAISMSKVGSRDHIATLPPELRRCAETIELRLG